MGRGKSALIGGAVVVAVLGIVGATVLVAQREPVPVAAPNAPVGSATDEVSRSISRAQQQLSANPNDYRAWASLGLAYVEQARITADPTYYPRAQGALDRSLGIDEENNDVGLAAMGALANARHEFADAADWARRSQEVNPEGSTSYGVLTDALTQLGDYDGATAAIQAMLDLRPGIPSFTRASYNLELHGNVDGARSALDQALDQAFDASDIAFCRVYLGNLAFSQGDLDGAAEEYADGLRQVPDDPGLLLGQARVAAARGEQDEALAGYARVVAARPLPDSLVEYGNYLRSLGRDDEADVQFGLFDTTQQIFRANGVQDSLTVAYVAADRGDAEAAVDAAEEEYRQRQNVDAADALGWALHVAGRDDEALPYAEQALAQGARNALFRYHLGLIQESLGQPDQARSSLGLALEINPHFSPVQAPLARAALDELGGPP